MATRKRPPATLTPPSDETAPAEGASAEGAPVTTPPPGETQPAVEPKPVVPEPVAVRQIMIEVPITESRDGNAKRGLKDLSSRDARTLRRVTDALVARGQTLPDGRVVRDGNTALAWILSRLDV